MKRQILGAMIAVLTVSSAAWAGTEKFDSASFNSIIDQNIQAQEDLQKSLRQNAGIQQDSSQRRVEVIKEGETNYLVESPVAAPKKRAGAPAEKSNEEMHRVAQEFKALE